MYGAPAQSKTDFPLHIYCLSALEHGAVKPNRDFIEELLGRFFLGLDALAPFFLVSFCHAICLSFAFSFLWPIYEICLHNPFMQWLQRSVWIVTRLTSSSSLSNLSGPTTTHQIWWGISGLLLNLHGVGFKPGVCREFSGSGKAGHGRTRQQRKPWRLGFVCPSPGRRWGRVWVAALACRSSTFTKRNFIYEALDSDFIVPEMPGVKGSIEALSRVQVPQSTPVGGRQQQPVVPCNPGSRLSHV